ncbi:unnamed protein product [Diamesa hyperborea]
MTSNGGSHTISSGNVEERLMVAVRIRPLIEANDVKCIQVTPNSTLLFDEGVGRNKLKRYMYDNVFDETTTQEIVYQKTTAPLVKDVLNGMSAAVFAYGCTGSGKTHTMLGPNPKKAATTPSSNFSSTPGSSSSTDSNIPHSTQGDGLMVKAIADIFEFVESAENSQEFKVSISYMEIYNELIRDLLNPLSGPLELREDNRGNQTVAGLLEIIAVSRYEVISLLLKGNKARTVEPTAANQTSSRSHALLNVTVTHSSPLGTKQGKLFLTDLAGSERARKTKNRGKRLQEGAHINKSLLALGNCINALADGARYVNYRDSKLTRLLKEALSGKCKTVMIAHVAPEAKHRDESKNTLVYADRANHITTRYQNPEILEENRVFPTAHYQTLVTELREEVGRLRSKMLSDRPRSAAQKTQQLNEDPDTVKRKQELKYLREQIVLTFKQQMKLRRRLLESESHLLGLELDAERQHMVISHWQGRNGKLYDRQPLTERLKETEDETNEEDESSDSEANSALRNAWNELGGIERETKRYRDIRSSTERELEECRKRGVSLEDELPDRISSDEERELLSLLCRVHELEADKVSLQAERMARQAELRRRDLQLLRAERQRRLCEDIISTQRRIIEEGKVNISEELKELYSMYQQEIHASTYTNGQARAQSRIVYDTKLPPIYSRSLTSADSSSSSEWSPSPMPTIMDAEGNQNTFDMLMGARVRTRLPSISRRVNPSGQSTSSDD